jgi:transglutaminase-like putative cysteine protease
VLVLSASWLRLENPRLVGEALIAVLLAFVPIAAPAGWRRVAAAAAAFLVVVWLGFGAQPWELLPYRDERVLDPVAQGIGQGIVDFYAVLLPLDPRRYPEMHALVLCAIFGFTLAMALLVRARRPVGAAAVTVAGAGWPATLVGGQAVAVGALALAAALSIPLMLRVRSGPALLVGLATGALVVVSASWASSATTIARESALNWETWDIRGPAREAESVRFAWDSNYDGVTFPATKTVVLTVEGPDEPKYWRTSTLDLFAADHWFEDLLWLGRVDAHAKVLARGRLTPPRALIRKNWLEQDVRVEALVDDHLAAAGTPVALDARRIGTVFQLSGGVLRVRDPLDDGKRYRVWSYTPDPLPATLSAAGFRYPPATKRFLEIDGRVLPAFGSANRERRVEAMFGDPSFATFLRHRPMYDVARRVAGGRGSPYAAVLALEAWFRQRGGFRYDESPPRIQGPPPLVAFVTRTKAGYCQHFAGAMAAMLRMLGIPARVAVGFTSGTYQDGKWVVTDHDAHAWVEVWFAGQGWIPFDPTPGRGTFAGEYSFASASEEAVAALGRGELDRATRGANPPVRRVDIPTGDAFAVDRKPSLFGVALLLAAAWVLLVGVGKTLVRRARYATGDPRRAATACQRELVAFLRDQGIAVAPTATLGSLQQTVHREFGVDGRSFTTPAARARFGPPADSERQARAARKELRALLKRARAELSVWARFRGFVSLRSVRGEVSG